MVSFKDLRVWNRSLELTDLIFDISEKLPKKVNMALYSQMTASAVSIPSNIAEGQRRFSNKEFIHHLKYSLGSAAELETQLIICRRRSYINQEELNQVSRLLDEINAGIVALINSLEKM